MTSLSSLYVTFVLFGDKTPSVLKQRCCLGLIFGENRRFDAYCISLFVSLVFCVWMYVSEGETVLCCDSLFHLHPTRIQSRPSGLLGYLFLPLFVMQIIQQPCTSLIQHLRAKTSHYSIFLAFLHFLRCWVFYSFFFLILIILKITERFYVFKVIFVNSTTIYWNSAGLIQMLLLEHYLRMQIKINHDVFNILWFTFISDKGHCRW